MKTIIVQQVTCGFGKFSIAVVDMVDEYTEYNEDGSPKDGYGTAIEVRLQSPMIGESKMTTYEILYGDYRKIADMFTKLAFAEEEKLAVKEQSN